MSQCRKNTRVALVTGAGRRIGAAIAEHLHEAGFSVAIHCHHSRHEAEALCRRFNQNRSDTAVVLCADLAHKDENQMLIQNVINWSGQLHLLVNNASVFFPTLLSQPDEARSKTLFTVNVQAPFWLSLAARAHLAAQQGAIINITDIHAQKPLRGYAEYCQSKAALAMQTLSFAQEFAPDIRVNAVAPGAISWPEGDNVLNQDKQKKIIEKTLLKRHGDPLFIAQAVLALAENPFITGQTLKVDGGRF